MLVNLKGKVKNKTLDGFATFEQTKHKFSIYFASGHTPQAALVVAARIGFVVRSLNASKTFFALFLFLLCSLPSAGRNLFSRKSSLPPARSTRSRKAASSTSLWRASRK